MTVSDKELAAAPFNLDKAAIDWVWSTFAGLSETEKLGQIVLPLCRDLAPDMLDAMLAYGVGGVHRMPSRSVAELRQSATYAQAHSRVPLLMTADIEFSEKSSFADGTDFPNQMAVGATGDADLARCMGAVAAREGRYCGFNLSWTPVADVAFNHRSNVVNTRAFGSDARAVARMCSAYMDGAAENGFARVIKHWPGDGLDDRDQHFATTHNTLEMPVWHETFGAIYRQAIADGVQMIMAGHITLADYTRSLGDEASAPVHMPATVNADLNLRLLRGEFGFNGVIVSDASGMNGFQALGARSDLVPLCIESGCDILLFPDDVGQDIAHLQRGLETGALSRTRVDDAVLRILALKASLGLHLSHGQLPDADLGDASFATREHAVWAEQVSEQAVTLVKDTQNLLPLRPDVHRRILLAQLSKRFSPSGPLPDLQIAALLRAEGFEVTPYGAGQDINPDDFDIGMYVMAEEGVSAKEYLGPHWEALHGAFPASMDRLWHHLPTLYVSLGTPFLLFHMPECKTFVNAYSAIPVMQRAVVAALLGRTACCGQSPVDAFCGLTEARF